MLFADQLRGADGTGIFYNNKDRIKHLKAPVASSDFVNSTQYNKAVAEAVQQGNFVVGHNRSATKGQLIPAHTHPFRENHITLVHNGTLIGHEKLKDVEVDSHAICHSIATCGIEETVKKINGAYALIWYDSKQKTLNFIRNSQRPLWLIETAFFYIFVSEPGLAHWICQRNRQDIKKTTEVPVNTMYTFKHGEWDTFSTKTVNPYVYLPPAPYVPQYNTASAKVNQSDPKIGEAIKFVPVEIDPLNETKLIGEWEDTKTGELVEVRFWATTKHHAKQLLNAEVLQGSISHIAYNGKEKSRFFILKDAYVSKVEPKEVVAVSFNKRKLSKEDIGNIKGTCTMCGGALGTMYHACNITQGAGDTLNGTCPDCTEWIYHEAQNNRMH